jgi:hypothetical protein
MEQHMKRDALPLQQEAQQGQWFNVVITMVLPIFAATAEEAAEAVEAQLALDTSSSTDWSVVAEAQQRH